VKILIIHNKYKQKGGEDQVVENEYKLLKKNGNEVEVIYFTNENIKENMFSKIQTFKNGIYNTTSKKIVKEEIDKFQPDIIHIHNFFPIASPSIFFLANKMKIPIVMTLHNYRLICPNALLLKENDTCEVCINKTFPIDGVLNRCYRNSFLQTFALASIVSIHKILNTWKTKIDKYIVLTNFARDKFLSSSLFIKEDKFVVKANFSDDFGFSYEKDDYYIFIGRLSKEKGIKVLLEAFKKIDKKVLIIGDGELNDEVKRYSEKYKNIIYLGFRDHNFIIQKLKKAKALIFPSIWYEGFPMVIVEALSTATPAICSNIGGPKEIVKDLQCGLHFEKGNINDLIDKINNFENDLEFQKKLIINSRKEYEEHYTEEINYKKLMEIYQDVISKK
jgi:glycosyltransferase involved in cell wall biosynthesis